MTESEKSDVLNVIQEVFRGVVMAMVAIDPQKLPDVAKILVSAASTPRLDPRSQQMLADLAAGLEMIASVEVRKN